MTEPVEYLIDDWLFRVESPPPAGTSRVMIAVHGLTGNQHSMEIFTRNFQQDCYVILPRAPYPAKQGGFSWIPLQNSDQEDLNFLRSSAHELILKVNKLLSDALLLQPSRIDWMGFSQGAAICLCAGLALATRPAKIALLSGFLPQGLPAQPGRLEGRHVLIAHGRRDKIVPVAQAEELAAYIRACGGEVHLCLDDTGHKLGKNCARSLQQFFRPAAEAANGT